MKMSTKAQLQQLQSLIMPLVGVMILLAIGFLVLSEVRSQTYDAEGVVQNGAGATPGCNATSTGACSYGVNATVEIQSAMDDIPGWLPIIIITVIGAIVIGLVGMFRGGR